VCSGVDIFGLAGAWVPQATMFFLKIKFKNLNFTPKFFIFAPPPKKNKLFNFSILPP
jgi:hypothetical protein